MTHPSEPPPERADVEQIDRDAAADFWDGDEGHPGTWAVRLRAGDFDDSRVVQAFARHRRTALTSLSAEMERVRNAK